MAVTRPVSSFISLNTASSGVSFSSMPPPGIVQTGTSLLIVSRMLLSFRMIPMTAFLGIFLVIIELRSYLFSIVGSFSVRFKKIILFFSLLLFSGCFKGHLFVQQQKVGADYLASSNVGTPDYRQKKPPIGERLIVAWDFPSSLYQDKSLWFSITVRFYDNSEKNIKYHLKRRRGSKSFLFSNRTLNPEKQILTYRIEVKDKEGKVVEIWKHHFWTEMIHVETGT